MNIPTHEEVAACLKDSQPGVADMIMGAARTEELRKRNCWGDLIMQVQHEFGPHEVATTFRRLYLKGWGPNVVKTWCPYSRGLWEEVCKARELQEEYAGLEEQDKKARKRTIYGALALVQSLWKKEREIWMRRWSLRSDDELTLRSLGLVPLGVTCPPPDFRFGGAIGPKA